jgi:arylsulfatase A-like enzyme/HEAT repeat protein
VATSRRGLLDATASVALAAALLDGVMAFARDAEAAWSVALVTLPGASVAFVLLVGLASSLAVALWRRTPSGARAWLGGAVFAAAGAVLGLALFSGTGVRRLGLQRPLVALATVVAAVLGVVVARRGLRSRLPTWLVSVAAVALYWVHATVLVRQYELLHALMAIGAAALWCSAASRGVREGSSALGRWRTGLALALSLGAAIGLARGNRARSVVRRVAPLGQYVARGVGALGPREIAGDSGRRARRAGGPSLPLTDGDVVLVTVDALRADQLRALGGRGRMPRLDALAARGLLFRRAYAATPHTSYSLASLMTGTHARAAMALGAHFGRGATLAGRLREAGFTTAGWYPPAVFSVDGDRFAALSSRHWDLNHAGESWDDAGSRVRSALAWARTLRRDQRAFAWVHLFEPHEPYVQHPEHPYGRAARERYDAECSAVDDALATLMDGWARPATWIVTADHGEEFGEHGGTFHGTSLYDEQARVPLVIVATGVSPRVVSSPVSLVDVLPTVLAGVGAAVPPGVEGVDLGVLALSDRPATQAFAETGNLRMVVDGDDKLIVDTADGTLERFDLAHDPAERHNLADEAPDRTRALRSMVVRWEAAHAEAAAARSRRSETVIPAALARALQGDRAAAPEVVGLLGQVDEETARRAARALGELGDDDGGVREGLAALLGRSPPLCDEAAVSLVRLGDERGRELATRVLLGASDEVQRRRAALGLARWRVPEAVPVLDAWAIDERASDAERDRVLALLQEMRSPSSRATWERLLESARLAPVAAAALGALGDQATIPALRATLARWRYPLTQRAVIDALLSLGDPEAVARMTAALGAGDPLDRVSGLLARAQEPGSFVAGWRGPSQRLRRRGTWRLSSRSWRPVQRLYLQLQAEDVGTVTVDGTEPVTVRRGAQQIVVTLPRPRVLRSVALRSSVGVSVAMIAAVPMAASP